MQDDLAIVISGKRQELTERANSMIERALLWANERKLFFSTTKTQTLLLKWSLTPDKPLDLRIEDQKVKMTPTAKYLRVTFDQESKFNDHLAEKTRDSVGLFSRFLSVAKSNWELGNTKTMTIYKGVFIPYIAHATST